jgi:hypothetical protein
MWRVFEILKFVQSGIVVKNASVSCGVEFLSCFLKPILVSVYQRYGSYCHNIHYCGKKQVILEIHLPILQGELDRWNYLILKEFSEISTPKRVHVAIETRDHSSVC